jgi:hypothetical protein
MGGIRWKDVHPMTLTRRGSGFRWWAGLLLVPLALALAGCGSKKAATVKGVVTYDGKKVPHGRITFVTEEEGVGTVTRSGKITDGEYSVPDVPVGKVWVGIVSHASSSPSATSRSKPPEDRTPPDFAKDAGGPKPPAGALPPTETSIEIPLVYGDPRQSNLTMEVEKGENVKDWPLKPTDREFRNIPLKGRRAKKPWETNKK